MFKLLLASSWDPSNLPIEVPESNSFLDILNSIWEGITSVFDFVTGGLRQVLRASVRVCHYLYDISLDVQNMSEHNSVGSLPLDQWFGAIRFIVGDLVYYEIYALIIIGLAFFAFQISLKFWAGIKYIINAVTYFLPSTVMSGWLGKITSIFK